MSCQQVGLFSVTDCRNRPRAFCGSSERSAAVKGCAQDYATSHLHRSDERLDTDEVHHAREIVGEPCSAISDATLGSVFIREWVAPILIDCHLPVSDRDGEIGGTEIVESRGDG